MINIHILNKSSELSSLDEKDIHSICNFIMNENNHKYSGITIIITNDNKLRELKKKYFHQDILTDVIAFNLEESGNPIEGEIYISFDRVKENAQQYMQDVITELKRVIIHGCLHLIGFDDQTLEEKKEMTRLENYYLNLSTIKN